MAKYSRDTLKRLSKLRLYRLRTGKKPPTLLTGKVEPIPDDKPHLKSIDNRFDLFLTFTIEDCVSLLRRILPYWINHQSKYAYEAGLITLDIRWWLTVLCYKSDRQTPPIPSDLIGIWGWVLNFEKALKREKTTTKRKTGKTKKPSMTELVRMLVDGNPKITFQKCQERINAALNLQGETTAPGSIRNALSKAKNTWKLKVFEVFSLFFWDL